MAEETDHGTGYYLTDNLGSIVGLVDGSGNTLAQYAYDPAGNTRDITGNLTELALNPFGYADGYVSGPGLTKYGARYYDPSTGRFTQQDPSGQESNPYAYTANNPMNYTDPAGTYRTDCGIITCSIFSTLVKPTSSPMQPT